MKKTECRLKDKCPDNPLCAFGCKDYSKCYPETSTKVILIGVCNDVYPEKIGESFLDHYSKEHVATFDNDELAKEYIKKSKLATPKHVNYGSDIVFKKESLLRSYEYAEIEDFVELEHNPKI